MIMGRPITLCYIIKPVIAFHNETYANCNSLISLGAGRPSIMIFTRLYKG